MTVSPTLSPGTILWSNPGDGSGVNKIVPAVPSSTGVADVFAFQGDGTVQAITADGTTAWTAASRRGLPDFQGGLIDYQLGSNGYIRKLDGMTGQAYPSFSWGADVDVPQPPVVHPDGTIFTLQEGATVANQLSNFLVGIDPTTGATKFSIPLPVPSCPPPPPEGYKTCTFDYHGLIVAGDGYAYLPAFLADGSGMRIVVVRADTNGGYAQIRVNQWNPPIFDNSVLTDILSFRVITNADQGIVLTWQAEWANPPIISQCPPQTCSDFGGWAPPDIGMAAINGTSVSLFSGPSLPGQAADTSAVVIPLLQTQDGTFVGVDPLGSGQPMIAFDANGSVRWSVPGGWEPQIATDDGGVIAIDDDTGAIVTFDRNGNATGQISSSTPYSLPTYSWKGAYQIGSIESLLPFFDLAFIAQTYAAVPEGNLTGNGFSLVHHTFGLVFCGPEGDGTCSSKYPVTTTPVSFSYLPVSSLNDQTCSAQAPTGPSDFSGPHSDWVQTIRNKAFDAYRAAFAQVPAILSQGWKANPISAAQGFEHTVYVSGLWHTGGDFGIVGEPTGQTAGIGNCNDLGVYPGICATSNVWYLDVMGYAQQALQFLPPGGNSALSPAYPPSDPTAAAQFIRVMTALGTGIGNIAAHETGHQLNLPQMDCSSGNRPACTEEYIYQNGNSSGLANDWFYGTAPGEKIHWSADAQCKIYKFLGMKNTGCP